MDENGNKKRRIARVGCMTNGKEATKLSGDEGLNKIDHSLVLDIMESMDKSQNVLSYHQLQEFRSKDKSISTNNSVSSSSGKPNSKISSTKQIKKLDSGKKNPLMAKCLQTMKNLKKNRSMPKPRAHVGPSQTPISRLQSNNLCNNQTDSNITVNHKEYPMKTSENSEKKRCAPEVNDRPKKAKTAHSVDKSRDTNDSQTRSFVKEPKFISDADTDSDNEFEQFIQKHHLENHVRRKITKNNKFKRKKSQQLPCANKVAKVTRRTLSDSEESMESEVDHNTEINRKEITSKKFKKIIDYDDSDTDYHVNDTCTLNYDSSSEDENIAKKSLNMENVIDCNVNRLATLPDQKSSVISSISTHEPKDSPPYCDVLKSKCKIPCYVMLKRDPLLDKRAASLYVDNSPVSNTVSVSNSNEDECIILSETSTINFIDQNSENNTPALEKNSNEKLLFNSNNLEPQIEKNSNEKSAESLLDYRNAEKGVSSVTALRKSLCDIEKDECHKKENSTECTFKSVTVVNPVSQEMSNLPNNEIDVSLNGDAATTATEKEMFNVQILSVKSLNDTDVIVLSDDNEEKDEDSDVEIICLDSSIVREESCVNENITHDINSEAQKKVNGAMKENSSSSSAQPLASVEQDCIILNDLDLPNENTCTAKKIDMVPSSQLVDITNNETTNSGKNVEISSDKESILKTLETIDFNCIKKVISATTVTDTQKESTPAKADNSFNANKISKRAPDSTLTKQKRGQNDTCLSQEQTAIDATIAPARSLDVVNKTNSQNTSAVETHEKHSKLVQNSNVLQNIKSGSENVPSSKKLNSDKSSSNVCDKSSAVNIKSSTIKAVPKSIVSKDEEIEIVAFSHKTEPNASRNSQKNQQLVLSCTKMESYANPADELDIIAAKSIKDLNQTERDSIVPLLELYREEYEKFMNIKCTEQNVTAGLKLLEEKQAKKLLAISSSIKNMVKNDLCFHKINNEYGSKRNKLKIDSVEKNELVDAIKKPSDTSSIGSYPDIEKDDKVKIFNQSVVKTASEYLKTDGPQEVYNHLINSVCAECGKHAVAACLGCAKVYYCSENCGLTHWNKGHYETCMR